MALIRVMVLIVGLVMGMTTAAQADERRVVQRDLGDAFLDDFNYTGGVPFGPPIRAQMPFNSADPDRDLIAATRVDDLGSIVAGGPYATDDDLFAAFYANQEAFNSDPDRNRIRMNGTIREIQKRDGEVLAVVDLTYRRLPLTIYTLSSWEAALAARDLTLLEPVLVDGTLSGHLHQTLVLPYPGAPLLYWQLEQEDDFRFIAQGQGWLVDESGARTGRARVHVRQTCDRELGCDAGLSEVRVTPVGG